eukprot:1101746-Alexandrium_andersonii.AAC.1
MHLSGASGISYEVVSGAAQFKLRTPEASFVCSMSAGVPVVAWADSIRHSVRSVLVARVIEYLPVHGVAHSKGRRCNAWPDTG